MNKEMQTIIKVVKGKVCNPCGGRPEGILFILQARKTQLQDTHSRKYISLILRWIKMRSKSGTNILSQNASQNFLNSSEDDKL